MPAGFRRFVPIVRFVKLDGVVCAVTHMKQYANASVVNTDCEGRLTMSASRAIKYLAYAILQFGYLVLSEAVLFAIRNKTVGTFHLLPYYLAVYLIEILFGVLLGLEQLLKQRRQDGRWSVNIEKLVFLGLTPLAFYAFWLLIYGQVIHIPVNGFFVSYVLGGTLILGYAGVVSGYALITSFKKSERESPVAVEP